MEFEEREVASEEARLTSEMMYLRSARASMLARHHHATSGSAEAQLAGARSPEMKDLHQALQQISIPRIDLAAVENELLEYRLEALRRRRELGATLRAQLASFQGMLSRSEVELAALEVKLESLVSPIYEAVDPGMVSTSAVVDARPPPPPPDATLDLLVAEPAPPPSRQRDRAVLHVDLRAEGESNLFTGFSSSVADGGVFVATEQIFPEGTKVLLRLALPGDKSVDVDGTVSWTREPNRETPDICQGLGVKFDALDVEQRIALIDAASRREPIFHPD